MGFTSAFSVESNSLSAEFGPFSTSTDTGPDSASAGSFTESKVRQIFIVRLFLKFQSVINKS